MDHQFEKATHPMKKWRCTVCLQEWVSKSRTACPEHPVYQWGSIPDTVALKDSIFVRGLKLSEGQKPVAFVGNHKEPLYLVADCVPHGCTIEFTQGKYAFQQIDDGFIIWRVNGLSLTVRYYETYLHLADLRMNVYMYRDALREAAEWFANQLLTNADEEQIEDATEMISNALGKRFYEEWKRIITLVPADVEELSRLFWSSVQGDCSVLHIPELYTDQWQYVRSDLKKYHACRMFAATLQGENKLDQLARWREALTPAVPNKALNKTLDKIPAAISYKQITRLSTIKLDKPVTNRLHLVFILCASEHHNWGLHEHTVISATPEMIKEAGNLFDCQLKTQTRTRTISSIARDILDYPEPYGGDLLGLARRSQEWHGEHNRRADKKLSPESILVVPDGIDLEALAAKGITLLRTAGDCYHEHDVMEHCIDTYASKAHAGLCYLFHVDYAIKDEKYLASIEISPSGVVVQAQGPRHFSNPACHYGVELLNKAFEGFKKGAQDVR